MRKEWTSLGLVVVPLAVLAGLLVLFHCPGPGGDQAGRAEGPGFAATAPADRPGPATATDPAAAAEADRPDDAPAGRLLVHVTSGGQPVEGAEVRIYRRAGVAVGDPWVPARGGRSGPDGLVALAAASGGWLVSGSAPGLARGMVEVLRPSNESSTRVELALGAGVEVAGLTVERRGGAPVPLASVAFTPVGPGGPGGPGARGRRTPVPEPERFFATSDPRGRFTVTNLAAGRYDVEARAVGHATEVRRDLAVPESTGLRLELGSAGTIEGTVTLEGRPVEGAEVTAVGAAGVATIQSGARGGFALEVEPGLLRLVARQGSASGAAERPVEVAPGEVLRGVELRLGPGAGIFGQVRSAAGPVAGAVVTAALLGQAALATRATTAADGTFELARLTPGHYAMQVTAQSLSAGELPGIGLRPGDHLRLDVTLQAPTAIEGTVSDGDGRPVSGALVSALGLQFRGRGAGPGGPQGGSVADRSDASGHFRLEGVAAGRVRLAAARDGAPFSATATVDAAEGETAHVDLTMVEGGFVGGRLLDSAGQGVAGATVIALPSGRAPRPGEANLATSDAAGAWRLTLAAGAWGLSAFRPGGAGRAFGRPPVLASVELAAGQSAVLDLHLPDDPAPTLTGRVVEPGGAPSAGAVVWVGQPGQGMLLAQADGGGAFALAAPAGGELQLNGRNGGRTGSLAAAPPSQDLLLTLQPAATLHGQLEGSPPPESFTVSNSARGFVPGGRTPDQQFAGAAFDLEDLLPGPIALHVKAADGRVGDGQVTLQAGQAGSVRIQLSPAATLAGRLIDATTGAPVTRARLLVDGLTSLRGSIGADGRFTRTVSAGDHALAVAALGYQPLTVKLSAAADGVTDLGDLKLAASAPQPPGPPR